MTPIEITNDGINPVQLEIESEARGRRVIGLGSGEKLMIESFESATVSDGDVVDNIFGLALGGTINGIFTGLTSMILRGRVENVKYQGFGEGEIFLRNTRQK